ncbi:MAG: DUF6338 family protein [Bacillota bacterium]|nr:DUF6338 family protein [Bacillota bacterium]MDW7683884.1 DUF6338 family protein [Bacillota bacterium]
MNITDLTVRLLLIFFPGIVATLIYEALSVQEKRQHLEFFIRSFVFGMGVYSLLALIQNIIVEGESNCFLPIINSSIPINEVDILKSTLMSIPLAIVVAAISNYKIVYRVARFFRITKVHGFSSVWEAFFDSPQIEWVVIRDIQNDIMYEGWIEQYSDVEEDRELLLRQVLVYRNTTGERYYKEPLASLYISIPKNNNVTIEVTKFEEPKKEDKKRVKKE